MRERRPMGMKRKRRMKMKMKRKRRTSAASSEVHVIQASKPVPGHTHLSTGGYDPKRRAARCS
jgi:hypothetical protein